MIRPLNVQQPFPQDLFQRLPGHVIFLKDFGVVEDVVGGGGVGDY